MPRLIIPFYYTKDLVLDYDDKQLSSLTIADLKRDLHTHPAIKKRCKDILIDIKCIKDGKLLKDSQKVSTIYSKNDKHFCICIPELKSIELIIKCPVTPSICLRYDGHDFLALTVANVKAAFKKNHVITQTLRSGILGVKLFKVPVKSRDLALDDSQRISDLYSETDSCSLMCTTITKSMVDKCIKKIVAIIHQVCASTTNYTDSMATDYARTILLAYQNDSFKDLLDDPNHKEIPKILVENIKSDTAALVESRALKNFEELDHSIIANLRTLRDSYQLFDPMVGLTYFEESILVELAKPNNRFIEKPTTARNDSNAQMTLTKQ